jgi:hypothetical protein
MSTLDSIVTRTGHAALLRMWDKRQWGYRAMDYRIEEQREPGEISETCGDTTACL